MAEIKDCLLVCVSVLIYVEIIYLQAIIIIFILCRSLPMHIQCYRDLRAALRGCG
jgi:hypothetical protein